MKFAFLLSFVSILMQAKILVHGHRGARAIFPENSLPAFEYAIAQGVDAIELDLAVTKDDILVVSHDPEMNPKICTGPPNTPHVIREMTLAQLRRWDCGSKQNAEFPRQTVIPGTRVPTFDEVLALAPKGNFDFNVETKSFPDKPQLTPPPAEFVKLVLAAVRKHKLEKRLILQSFDWRTLIEMHKLAPAIRLSALYPTSMTEAARNMDYVEAAKATGAQIVSPHVRLVTKARVDQAHATGLQVVPWTANEPKIWDALIAAGVDAIITDDPAALIAYLRETNHR